MKVCQEIDVDGVTIIINPQNKLEAVLPEDLLQESEFEEIELTDYMSQSGYDVYKETYLPSYGVNNKEVKLAKLVRLKGTDYYMFKLEGVVPADTETLVEPPVEPPADNQPETPPSNEPQNYVMVADPPTVRINRREGTYTIEGTLRLKGERDGTFLTNNWYEVREKVASIVGGNIASIDVLDFEDGSSESSTYVLKVRGDQILINDSFYESDHTEIGFSRTLTQRDHPVLEHDIKIERQVDHFKLSGSGKFNPSIRDPFYHSFDSSYYRLFLFGYDSTKFNYIEV